ncbi:hypothetical protein [Kordia sp.]|uniref:hypothetical protein n=1 Tax=Kordia sp. TaxID=1965332 RepID=UPI0038705E44
MATTNQQYYVNTSSPEELYSKKHVAYPRPKGLYTRIDASYAKGKYLYGWIPNVRLLNHQEKNLISVPKMGGIMHLEYQKPKLRGWLKSTTHTFDLQAEKAALENPQKNAITDKLPKFGIMGKNDCGHFASALQKLIAHEEPKKTGKRAVSETLDANEPTNANKLTMDVGDKMQHNYNEANSNSQHHAATVVAKDGSSLVTLEAHVGKSLKKPQFNIRNGVKGFVADNNVGHGWTGKYDRELGSSVDIGRIGTLEKGSTSDNMTTYKNNYAQMSDYEAGANVAFLKGALGITKTEH